MSLERVIIDTILMVSITAGTGGVDVSSKKASSSGCENNARVGRNFQKAVNWHDEGHSGLKGSVYDLYPVFLDENGKIIEEGEVSGYYWVMGADGKRVYYEIDPCEPQGK